jgi:hypothetical protein
MRTQHLKLDDSITAMLPVAASDLQSANDNNANSKTSKKKLQSKRSGGRDFIQIALKLIAY